MSTDLILYDRLWLDNYIGRIAEQKSLAYSLEEQVERERALAPPELRAGYGEVLGHIRELKRSLSVTEDVLRNYLGNADYAAFQLQRQCEEIGQMLR